MRDLSMEALIKAAKKRGEGSPKQTEAEELTQAGVSEELARKEAVETPPTVGMLTELVDNRANEDWEPVDNEDPELDYIKRCKAAEELLASLSWRAGMTFQLASEARAVRYWPAAALTDEGRTELERVKNEVYEILLEDREHSEYLASQPEVDPLPDDEYEAWGELSNEHMAALSCWIEQTLQVDPDLKPSNYHTSYNLKHMFARSPDGFYVSDEAFRGGMWLSGFLGRRIPGRRNKEVGTRYYYVRPNREGLIEQLAELLGVPPSWARDAIMGADDMAWPEDRV